MVEAGRIDHAHHANNAFRALGETIELARAVETALQLTSAEGHARDRDRRPRPLLHALGLPEARQPDPRRGRAAGRRRAAARRHRPRLHGAQLRHRPRQHRPQQPPVPRPEALPARARQLLAGARPPGPRGLRHDGARLPPGVAGAAALRARTRAKTSPSTRAARAPSCSAAWSSRTTSITRSPMRSGGRAARRRGGGGSGRMQDAVVRLLSGREGRFALESGHHGALCWSSSASFAPSRRGPRPSSAALADTSRAASSLALCRSARRRRASSASRSRRRSASPSCAASAWPRRRAQAHSGRLPPAAGPAARWSTDGASPSSTT